MLKYICIHIPEIVIIVMAVISIPISLAMGLGTVNKDLHGNWKL